MNLFDAIFKPRSLDRTAILFEEQRISYAELRDRTVAVARLFSALGVSKGDRVAIMLNDSPEFIAAFIAICSSGAIAVPINMGLRPDEQRAILGDSSASLAIVEGELGMAVFAKTPLKRIVFIRLEGELTDDAVGCVDIAGNNGGIEIRSVAALMSEVGEITFPEPAQDQPAFILYTSGSTGEPKGAVHRQSDIFYTNQTYCREVLQLRDSDRLWFRKRLHVSVTQRLYDGSLSREACRRGDRQGLCRVQTNHLFCGASSLQFAAGQ